MKIGKYDHKGTSEMEKLANKFPFSDEEEDSDEVEAIESTTLTKVEENAKGPLEQDFAQGSTKRKMAKKPKLAKEPILLIVEHPTPNIMVVKGKSVNTQSIIEPLEKF